MDNIRILLWFAFLAMLWLGFTQWTEDYRVEPPPATTEPVSTTFDSPLPPPGAGTDTELPGATDLPAAAGAPTAPAPETSGAVVDPIHVRTDVLDLIIDRRGGDIVRADLPTYPIEKHDPEHVVRLLDYAPSDRWVYQTGVYEDAEAQTGPTHRVAYRSAASDYVLADGQDQLVVTLDWTGDDGVSGSKRYRFTRGGFAIELDIDVRNGSARAWQAVPYAQMVRRHVPSERRYLSVDSYSFRGPVVFDGNRYEKLDVEDLAEEPLRAQYTDGWVASIQHHFLAALAPPAGEQFSYQATTRGDEYTLTAAGFVDAIDPQSSGSFRFDLFVGPKVQDQLSAMRDKLELTVDYGTILTPLAKPLFWLLEKAHSLFGNWGWAIIAVTFLIKLAFYKLTATSGRSLAKMRKVGPRLKALQERYKDDRQALSQAMMELYKKEKINPAAGCLPILIQMPFFFAFYWVLIESVEMRQAPFMLWIDDLSQRDPFFVLPVLMGAAMLFQQRLSPAPPDPMQARIMQIMPLVFCGMFAFFPAGLVLYWLTNTVLSIAQQWRINKLVAAES